MTTPQLIFNKSDIRLKKKRKKKKSEPTLEPQPN